MENFEGEKQILQDIEQRIKDLLVQLELSLIKINSRRSKNEFKS